MKLSLNLPPNTKQLGWLYCDIEPELNDEDCLEIELPNGRIIDVGWYPECDPTGEFWIRVYDGEWKNQLVEPPIKTRDPHEVKTIVEKLAVEHSTP